MELHGGHGLQRQNIARRQFDGMLGIRHSLRRHLGRVTAGVVAPTELIEPHQGERGPGIAVGRIIAHGLLETGELASAARVARRADWLLGHRDPRHDGSRLSA
jgi:hypothetical protein